MRQHNSEAILKGVSEKPSFFPLTKKMLAYWGGKRKIQRRKIEKYLIEKEN